VNVSKSTILRAIRGGRMSAGRTEDDGYAIDPAELFRVCQPKSNDNGAHSPKRDNTQRELDAQIHGLKEMRDLLLAQLEDCKRDRDAWRLQAEAVARLTYQRPKSGGGGNRRPARAIESQTKMRGFRKLPARPASTPVRITGSAHAAAALCVVAFFASDLASAQDKGTVTPKPLPPLAKPDDPATPARELFARKGTPAALPARSIGFYSKGCLAGAVALPIRGQTWEVMRVSRNRNWGHPALVQFIEQLSKRAAKRNWPGLLIGDMSQPRGGPMLNGHTSHQVGLDVDIWLRPMPGHHLTRKEREEMMATVVVARDRKDVDSHVWTPAHAALIKAAAEDPRVNRIFVNTAIKTALCREAGDDRAWLRKVQPWLGHDWHFHVRLNCPADSPGCEPQQARTAGDGCAGIEMHRWASNEGVDMRPAKPRPGPKMVDLPSACRQVLNAPERDSVSRTHEPPLRASRFATPR
jgi:penicillin-insensitive murein DD-endopeptidase